MALVSRPLTLENFPGPAVQQTSDKRANRECQHPGQIQNAVNFLGRNRTTLVSEGHAYALPGLGYGSLEEQRRNLRRDLLPEPQSASYLGQYAATVRAQVETEFGVS